MKKRIVIFELKAPYGELRSDGLMLQEISHPFFASEEEAWVYIETSKSLNEGGEYVVLSVYKK